ncbi:NAD(P)H-binding protein [Mucilaginibacter sp. CAU 1740]|uniref:NAD(P)H-binding protein n=1 Tax=Mucilaginibacter sp. CAU 1740 TaxID=3140365 RepID=UPI00325B15BF
MRPKKDGLADLTVKGIDIRIGDYFDYNSLLKAFKGVDKVMLTSAVAFTDRATQHYNVITAARQAGVKHLVYMSIMRKKGSERIMPEITESDLFTEQVLKSSGLDYTIVYQPPFTDVLTVYYGTNPYEHGIKVPAGNAKMAPAMSDELAEAHAEILATPGHEKKTYSLGGSEAISFAGIAQILADIKGKPVPFSTITAQEYIDNLVAKGTPHKVAEFLKNWVIAIKEGEFEYQSGDLERLLGRKTKTFREYIETTLI